MWVAIETIKAYQAHPVPNKILTPRGPFPADLFQEPEVVVSETIEEFDAGATAQNNFKPHWLRCVACHDRVRDDKTDQHVCEE